MRDKCRFHIAIAVALVFGVASRCAYGQGQAAATTENSEDDRAIPIVKLKLPGVPNFGEVTPTLYRGAHASPQGLRNLKAMGIQIIIDLRGRKRRDERRVEELGMQYVRIGGTCFPQSDEKYAKFLSVVDNNPGKKIFVECTFGDDRTGMAVAAFRMANQGYTPDQAMQEMRAYGFNKFHHFMCWFLASYEEHFLQKYATSPAFAEDRKLYPPPKQIATSQ